MFVLFYYNKVLEKAINLRVFSLSGNDLSDERAFHRIVVSLRHCRRLHSVSFDDCNLNDNCIPTMQYLFQNLPIERFSMRNSLLSREGQIALLNAMCLSAYITNFDWSVIGNRDALYCSSMEQVITIYIFRFSFKKKTQKNIII